MKKLMLCCFALFYTSPLLAQSDVTVSFFISGLFGDASATYNAIKLDVNFQTNTLSVNGTIDQPNGLSSPATGTCFVTAGGGAYCNLQVDQLSLNVSLNRSLSGTIQMKNSFGVVIDEAPIFAI